MIGLICLVMIGGLNRSFLIGLICLVMIGLICPVVIGDLICSVMIGVKFTDLKSEFVNENRV